METDPLVTMVTIHVGDEHGGSTWPSTSGGRDSFLVLLLHQSNCNVVMVYMGRGQDTRWSILSRGKLLNWVVKSVPNYP